MYSQSDLPYDFNALEPAISAEIMEIHYSKHHKTYVAKLNEALEKYAAAESKSDLPSMIALQQAIRFNGGGHINHALFWENLAPVGRGGEPQGVFLDALKKEFGSVEKFIETFNAETAAIQGSGWGWLGYNRGARRLEIATCANQDPLSTKGLVPLLGVDVWEHAYYLQYKNVRPDYLKNVWTVMNWSCVAQRYAEATK